MIDIHDVVNVPDLGIEKGIVIGRTFGRQCVDVQAPDGRIHKDIHFADAVHSDPVKRKHAARPAPTQGEKSHDSTDEVADHG